MYFQYIHKTNKIIGKKTILHGKYSNLKTKKYNLL